jgi:streptogramin lyase
VTGESSRGRAVISEAGGNKIGRITTSGAITEYPIPTAFSQAEWITAGPDGSLWFAEAGYPLGNGLGLKKGGAVSFRPSPAGKHSRLPDRRQKVGPHVPLMR